MTTQVKKEYELTFRNIGLEGFELGEAMATGTVKTSSLSQAISKLDVQAYLAKKGLNFEQPIGTVIDYSDVDNLFIIGHDGSDDGNLKTIENLEICWKEKQQG